MREMLIGAARTYYMGMINKQSKRKKKQLRRKSKCIT
jgi:hypothetical protein